MPRAENARHFFGTNVFPESGFRNTLETRDGRGAIDKFRYNFDFLMLAGFLQLDSRDIAFLFQDFRDIVLDFGVRCGDFTLT